MLTTAHANRGRPTLKDDERFRNGLVRDLKINANINAKMNAKLTKLNLITMLYKNCLNMSVNCSNPVNRSTKNMLVVEVNLQGTGTIKHPVVILLTEEARYMNTVWKYIKLKCIEVTVLLVIFFFACIIYRDVNVMQNKLDVIQQFIISSSVYLFCIVHAQSNVLPDKTESMLSVQVIADIDSETLTAQECRSRYAKFYILSETRDNCHVGRRDREPSRILAKKLSRLLNKNRKLRKLVRNHIKLNVPRSSRIHRLLYAFSHERKKLLNDQVRYLPQVTKKTKCPQESSRRRRKQAATLKTTAFLF